METAQETNELDYQKHYSGNEKVDKKNEEDDKIPDNFAKQIAMRIVIFFEKELNPQLASENTAKFIFETTFSVKRIPYFIDALDLLLDSPSTEHFASMALTSIVTQSAQVKEYEDFIQEMTKYMLESFYDMEKPEIELKGRKFSAMTGTICSCFIKMYEIDKSFSDVSSEIFTILMRNELNLEQEEEDEWERRYGKGGKKRRARLRLYDDILEYLRTRYEMKSGSLSEDNPNEHILTLTEKLRSNKHYVMQDIVNQRAIQKKKQLEKEIENRLASSEEILMIGDVFVSGLYYFVKERKYNTKFLGVEQVRMTLQLIGAIIAVIYFLLGFMNQAGIDWIDGVFVCATLLIFSHFVTSRDRFSEYFPEDVSKELEQKSSQFIQIFKNMSGKQLEKFIIQQVRNDENERYLRMLPEYFKYLYAIMPDRRNMIVDTAALQQLVENSEVEIVRHLLGK